MFLVSCFSNDSDDEVTVDVLRDLNGQLRVTYDGPLGAGKRVAASAAVGGA